MDLLHVVHQYMPEKIGGAELYTRALAMQQVEAGHTVAIFTPASARPAGLDVAQEGGVSIYRAHVGRRSATAVFQATFRQPNLSAAFHRVLQQVSPDLVHIQHLMGLPSGIVNAIRDAGIPYVVTLHDYWYLCANAQLLTNYDNTICQGPDWWVNCGRCALARAGKAQRLPLAAGLAPLFAYRQARLRRVLDNAQALIAPTRFTRDVHVQMGIAAEKVHVIPHGIELPESLPRRSAAPPGLHVAYVGGLAWQKGVHVLVTAVNQLPHDRVRLTIMGDETTHPAYVAELKATAVHPGIRFAGRVAPKQLWQALSTVDVVVVPSLWYETASLIVQEAFAAGIPVVASAIGALHERVNPGVDGLHVPPGDPTALAGALRRFLDDPSLHSRLAANIRPVFTIRQHLDAIEQLVQTLGVWGNP